MYDVINEMSNIILRGFSNISSRYRKRMNSTMNIQFVQGVICLKEEHRITAKLFNSSIQIYEKDSGQFLYKDLLFRLGDRSISLDLNDKQLPRHEIGELLNILFENCVYSITRKYFDGESAATRLRINFFHGLLGRAGGGRRLAAGGGHGVAQQAGHRHRADAAGHRRDRAGDLAGLVGGDVADQAAFAAALAGRDPVDADVDDHRA